MIELQHIRLDKAAVIAALSKRGLLDAQEKIEAIAALDLDKRMHQVQLEALATALNQASKEMGAIIQGGGNSAALTPKKKRCMT